MASASRCFAGSVRAPERSRRRTRLVTPAWVGDLFLCGPDSTVVDRATQIEVVATLTPSRTIHDEVSAQTVDELVILSVTSATLTRSLVTCVKMMGEMVFAHVTQIEIEVRLTQNSDLGSTVQRAIVTPTSWCWAEVSSRVHDPPPTEVIALQTWTAMHSWIWIVEISWHEFWNRTESEASFWLVLEAQT